MSEALETLHESRGWDETDVVYYTVMLTMEKVIYGKPCRVADEVSGRYFSKAVAGKILEEIQKITPVKPDTGFAVTLALWMMQTG
jgi:hypothetical protein